MYRHPNARWFAASLFALAAIAPISSWWLLLFYATPPSLSTTDAALAQLSTTFSSTNRELWWFIGWALLPLFLVVTAVFYCTPLVGSRRWSVVAAVAAFVVTMCCLAFAPSVGLFLLVPLGLAVWWAYGA
jgi:hypothetical protein